MGVYPSTSLYPSSGLYPSAPLVEKPRTFPASAGSLVLCDRYGEEIVDLEVDHTLRFERSKAGSVKYVLRYDQPGASDLFGALATSIPQVRAYRKRSLVLAGWWAPHNESAAGADSDGITAEFRTPFARLETRYLSAAKTYTGVDAGAIAIDLINTTNGDDDSGLSIGRYTATTNLDRQYAVGQQIAQAVLDLTGVVGSFQFTETPLPTNAGAVAAFNIWSSLGRDLSATAKFEYGETTLGNVVSVQRTMSPPINRAIAIGDSATTTPAVVNDFTSQSTYGLYTATNTFPDIKVQSQLTQAASSMLQSLPTQEVVFAPDIDNDLQPIDDYWLGDKIRLYARQSSFQLDLTTQITAIEIDRDGNGIETAHRVEIGQQWVKPLKLVRRGRKILFRDPIRP